MRPNWVKLCLPALLVLVLIVLGSSELALAARAPREPVPAAPATPTDRTQLPTDTVYDLAFEGSVLWAATAGGALRLNTLDDSYTVYTSTHGLPYDDPRAVAVTPAGIKWFGSYGGATRYDDATWTTYTNADGLGGSLVWTIAIDESGDPWFGTSAGVSHFDGATWTNYTAADGLAEGYVFSSFTAGANDMWFGSWSGASHLDGATWTTYTTTDGLASDYINAIAGDGAGNVWFGTDAGVTHFDGATWTTYTTIDGLPSNDVNAVAVHPNGDVWLGTNAGAVRYNGAWTTFTTEEGLASDVVNAIAFDADGGIWFGTDAGVSFYASNASLEGPAVTSITPASAYGLGPVHITQLSGEGFEPGAAVRLRRTAQPDIHATNVTVVNSTTITCDLDLTAAENGYWNIIVTNPDETFGTLYPGFLVVTLTATAITPASGVNTGVVEISDLAGEGFFAGMGFKLTREGQPDIAATHATVITPTRMIGYLDLTGVPTGTWDIVITAPQGRSGPMPAHFAVATVAVAGMTPAVGANSGSVHIHNLAGAGFESGATVRLIKTGEPDIVATNVIVESAARITCDLDLNGASPGVWDVVVTNAGGGSSPPAGVFEIFDSDHFRYMDGEPIERTCPASTVEIYWYDPWGNPVPYVTEGGYYLYSTKNYDGFGHHVSTTFYFYIDGQDRVPGEYGAACDGVSARDSFLLAYGPGEEPAPVASFTAPLRSGSSPLTVVFDDTSTGGIDTWAWDLGDGGTSSAQDPLHTYTAPGTYTVTLTASGPGGSDTLARESYITVIEAPPAASFTAGPLAGEPPLTVVFTDTSTGAVTSWSWTFGDGKTSTAQHPSHTYTAAGTYTVTLTATGPGGNDTLTRANYVNVGQAAEAPVAGFAAAPRFGAPPLSVAFTDTSTGPVTSWSWTFGDGGTSIAQHPTHVYAAVGTYTVTLAVSGPGGSDSETKVGYIGVAESLPPRLFLPVLMGN